MAGRRLPPGHFLSGVVQLGRAAPACVTQKQWCAASFRRWYPDARLGCGRSTCVLP